MKRQIKFKFHFDNHAPVVLTLMDLITGDDFFNLYRNDAGRLIAKLQFTGLKDKNGKDIYEGDIVTRPYRDLIVTGTVVFSIGFASFKTEFDSSSIDGVKSKTVVPFMPHEMDQIEVIGNIYQDKDILTQLDR